MAKRPGPLADAAARIRSNRRSYFAVHVLPVQSAFALRLYVVNDASHSGDRVERPPPDGPLEGLRACGAFLDRLRSVWYESSLSTWCPLQSWNDRSQSIAIWEVVRSASGVESF